MGAVAIIPARLGSTRFPRKVLAADTGRPLIQHVCQRAALARRVSRVVVATDADEVARAVRGFGGEVVMTRADHPNGTSRLAEAAATLSLSPDSLIVNVQGDEPEVEPDAIDAAIDACERSGAQVATIASHFSPGEDPSSPHLVKVVRSMAGDALYFSRALIPHHRDPGGPATPPLRHVGLYVYRRDFLDRYASLSPTPLEQTESLEQLRVLEHGYRIAVAVHDCTGQGIDTPEQYRAFVARWRAAGG
jgi:3-deoxy-manno-octulosonate cytidylyltransferase (CMP-KDO synthetase)